MMKNDSLLITSLPLIPLPCEPPRTKEHYCRSPTIHVDTWGPSCSRPFHKHSRIKEIDLMSSPWTAVTVTVTDDMYLRSLDNSEKLLSPFSLPCVFLCTPNELQLCGDFLLQYLLQRAASLFFSLNLKGKSHIFQSVCVIHCIHFIR